MAERENKQIGEWRRGRSRNGSMINVNFNGGGILLLGAAAAGALLAAAFAVRRVSSHRRRRGATERNLLDRIDQEGIQEKICKHLDGVEVPKIVEDEADKAGRVDQVNSSDNFDASHEISQVIKRESDADLLKEEDGEVAERSSSKKIELAGGVEGELACFRDSSAEICSSPVSTCSNLGICCSLLENHSRYDNEKGLVTSVKEEGGMPCKISKEEDEEDYKREIVEKSGEAQKFEEQNTSPNLSTEELQQLEKKDLQNLEMVIIKEESNFGNGVEDDSGKHPEMIIEEDGRIGESDRIKDAVSSDVFCDENGNAEGDSSVHKVLDGPGGLGEQTVVIGVSESECNCQDPDMVMKEENAHLMTHDNGVVHIEEEVKEEENSELPSADKGVGGLRDEVQRATNLPIGSPIKEAALSTEIYTSDKPALIMVIEETQLEDNTNTDLNVVIQESVVGSVEIQNEMTEESLLNESQENMESSEIVENNRENKEPHSAESHERIKSSLEQDNQMQNEESPMIQFQGIELATREDKVSSEDKLPLSLEPSVMEVEPIQKNKLRNSEKALKIEECNLEASTHGFIDARKLGICPSKEEEGGEDKTISVQSHKIETMQNLEADKSKKTDGMEGEIEYHKTLPLAEMNEMPGYVGGILKELHASDIKEQEEEQAAKLSFDVVKGVIKLVSVNQKKRQRQAEKNFEKNYLKKLKQKRTEAGKEKTTECMFTGYPKGPLFMMIALAVAFAILAIIYHDEFHHWSCHLGKNYHRLYQTFYSSYNITC